MAYRPTATLAPPLAAARPLFILLSLLAVAMLGACGSDGNGAGQSQGTSVNLACTQSQIDALPVEALSPEEEQALIFMREEEKLAHDVYLHLYDSWNLRIFSNIAESEQTHTDSVVLLLDRYAIADPAATTARGEFVNPDLQQLYNQLSMQGDASLISALNVGALIEDLDIYDLQNQLDNVVDNQDIGTVWANLQKGSRNHLRAFVSQLARQNMDYTPQYIDPDIYASIINSPMESGNCLN